MSKEIVKWDVYVSKWLRIDSEELEGGRCMRGSDGRLCFSEKERGKVWKDYRERIMNEENDCDHNVVGDAVEGSVDWVGREGVVQVLNEMKTGKAHGPLDTSLELIAASREVPKTCHRVLSRFVLLVDWALSMVFPIS